MKSIFAFVFLLASITEAIAAPQWWQQVYPSNSNSQITLKDENNNNVTAITNPTAASVKTNTNTSTQSPSIILQATATLPIKIRDTACDSTTNTAAITSDRAMLLTCQANIWRANLSQGTLSADGRVSGNTLRATLVATEGASCAAYQSGDQANSATGLILSCQSGVWKFTSPAPIVQTYAGGSIVPTSSWIQLAQIFIAPVAGYYWLTTTASCYQRGPWSVPLNWHQSSLMRYRYRANISSITSNFAAIGGSDFSVATQGASQCGMSWLASLSNGEVVYMDAGNAQGVNGGFIQVMEISTIAIQISQ